MESDKILTTKGDRYTVFSLWDTYRNVHQLLTLVYPERQLQMVRSMLDMYREHGWLPKWELYGRETLTMEGDPSIPVIVDTWLKGLRDFDIELAYEAMRKGATLPGRRTCSVRTMTTMCHWDMCLCGSSMTIPFHMPWNAILPTMPCRA